MPLIFYNIIHADYIMLGDYTIDSLSGGLFQILYDIYYWITSGLYHIINIRHAGTDCFFITVGNLM